MQWGGYIKTKGFWMEKHSTNVDLLPISESRGIDSYIICELFCHWEHQRNKASVSIETGWHECMHTESLNKYQVHAITFWISQKLWPHIPDWLIISGQSFYLYEGQQQLGKENVACSTHSRFQEAHCSHNHHIAYNFVKEEKAGALSARGQQTKGFGFWRRVYTQPPQWLSCSSGPLSTTTTIFLHLHTTILVVEEWSWPQWSFILLGQFMEWRETIYKV